MPKFEALWVELSTMDGFYSHTPGEMPLIVIGKHIAEGSSAYWRVFLGLLGVHYSLENERKFFPFMAFCYPDTTTCPNLTLSSQT